MSGNSYELYANSEVFHVFADFRAKFCFFLRLFYFVSLAQIGIEKTPST